MPLIRSEGSKSANQRGGTLQVAVIMCETLSSILSEFRESAFSISIGRKKLLIINDYANSNPYPTAIAINIERDNENLGDMI